jgi:1-acyl-sn-glycerol-3-phosphate acyltransferase
MRYLLGFIRVLFTIYGFIVFVSVLLIIFPLVVIASFFGKTRGGNFIYELCRIWADIILFSLGIRHRNIYEVPHDPSRHNVFVFNHISFLDGPIILKAIPKQHIRALGKAELAKVPLFGFLYRNIVVMVQRDSASNRAKSVKQLKSVLEKDISIVIAPEGTFNMTHHALQEFYDGAFKIAIDTQTPIKPILFLDAYDRMHYRSVFSITPGRSRAVYLEEVSVEGLTLADVPMLKQKVYDLMERKLIAYGASWIKDSTPVANQPKLA